MHVRWGFFEAPLACIALCGLPLALFDSFPLRNLVFATFIMCWPLTIFGFVASIPLDWMISETRCRALREPLPCRHVTSLRYRAERLHAQMHAVRIAAGRPRRRSGAHGRLIADRVRSLRVC